MKTKILWLVGEHQGTLKDGKYPEGYFAAWDWIGIFSTEKQAVAACYNERCVIGPIELNNAKGQERTAWIGSYYPKHPYGGKETAIKEETG